MKDYGAEIDEPLIFENAANDCAADIAPPENFQPALAGDVLRGEAPPLPGLCEPEAVRHFVRLSRKNYSIDTGIFPLGSCTMKHNPRLNEKLARLEGIADIHPLQPLSAAAGGVALMAQLSEWLQKLTGMDSVALSPRAGAHGELCGMMACRAALKARGEWKRRRRVLVPESAHGTNPATAALAGYEIESITANARGHVSLSDIKDRLDDDLAAIMLTNPNTCGLFEPDILEIADAVHQAGGYFYCDGANFNAIAGRVRPGDLGVDAMHINLHKTFSTPHGGGGPGSGPVAFSHRLARFAPLPLIVKSENGAPRLIETQKEAEALGLQPCGRLTAFHGQMGMFVRALAYMMSQGGDGIKQAAEDAVLSANYIRAQLSDIMSVSYPGLCMHEVLFDDRFLKGTGLDVTDFAKAMIDEGVHPMTIYFPLIVHGAMLVEPTETESKASLDGFIALMRELAQAALQGEVDRFKNAPRFAPRARFDETQAARHPVLRWRG